MMQNEGLINPEEDKLRIIVRDRKGNYNIKLVVLIGFFGVGGLKQADAIIMPLIEQNNCIIIDCAQLKYINSIGLGFLAKVSAKMYNRGLPLKIVIPKNQTYDIFKTVGLTRLIKMYETVDMALNSD